MQRTLGAMSHTSHDTWHLRSITAAAVLAAFLVACGGDDPAAAPVTGAATTSAPTTAPAPTATRMPTTSVALPAPSSTAPEATVPAGWEESLRAIGDAHASETVGAVLALRHADGATTTVSIGAATVDPGSAGLDPHTPLGIGSVTKTFVATVVLQLADEGALSLDAGIDAWFPELPDAEIISIRQLLEHSSGLGEYIDTETVRTGGARVWTPDELVQIAEAAGRAGRPGDAHHYANTNYVLLGQIVEQVTGNPWFDEVHARIVEPLGLEDTGLIGDGRTAGGALAPGYVSGADGWVLQTGTQDPSLGGAAGAMYSTVADLLTFATALSDHSLLSDPEIVSALDRFVPASDLSAFGVEHSYGLGIERYETGRLTVVGHMGVGSGHSAFVGYDALTGNAVAVVMNAAVPGPQAVMAIEVLGAVAGMA